MQRPRQLLLSLLGAVLTFGTALGITVPVQAAERPNIVFIFTDDHAPHAISAYAPKLRFNEGKVINQTPHIDRIAEEGMLFRDCFVTNSICCPSRAVILTGKHSHLNGVPTNRERFDGSQQTFPKLLQKAGYRTAIFGKWHLKSTPTGFDHYEVLYGQGPYYNPPLKTPEGRQEHTGYTTDIITDRTLHWLKKQRDEDRPFMVMSQHKAPHRNWQPGPDHLTKYDGQDLHEPDTLFDDYSNRTSAAKMQAMTIAEHMRWGWDLKLPKDPETGEPIGGYNRFARRFTPKQKMLWEKAYQPKNQAFYDAYGEKLTGKALTRWKYQRYIKDYLRCITSVDDNVGRLLDYLDESGLAENTVVIYSSDQGFYLGDHGWFDKRWMYEESLRMPFIVRWPGVTKPGSVDTHLTQNLDFAETFLDIAGVDVPDDMQGRSLVPLMKGKSPDDWRKSIYYHYYEYPGAHSVRRHYGVRTDRYKLIRYYNLDEWELFDLKQDPDELHSVYGDPDYAAVQKRLKKELERLQKKYGDTHPEADLSRIRQRHILDDVRKVAFQQVVRLNGPDEPAPEKPNPSAKPITVAARCTPASGDGVLVAQGGSAHGYSLFLQDGIPHFAVRSGGALRVVGGKKLPLNEPVHLAGVLDKAGKLHLYVDGKRVASGKGHYITQVPSDRLSIGDDSGSPVADYKHESKTAFDGKLRDIRIYWGVPESGTLAQWARR